MKNLSSNINEVIRAVLNPLLFFYEKILHSPKHQKHKKALNASTAQKKKKKPKHQKHRSTKTQPSKSTNRYKRIKIKNALKKHLRGEKLLIRLFAFVLFGRAKKK